MAIAATLLGAIFGFISFLIALLFLDYSFISACALYLAVGWGTIALSISAAVLRFYIASHGNSERPASFASRA